MKRTIAIAVVITIIGLGSVAVQQASAGKGHHCKADPSTYLAKMAAKMEKAPWLGVELDKSEKGHYRVSRVVADSPAEAAGFKEGDVLLALNGVAFSDKEQLKKVKHSLSIGDQVTYVVKRDGGKVELSATLAKAPKAVVAQWVGEHMLESHLEASKKG
jgi:S1-C subfamily serine protease